jgi:hypothetical protein
MSLRERERLVRWWVEQSGLASWELRQVAAALWTEPLLEERRAVEESVDVGGRDRDVADRSGA